MLKFNPLVIAHVKSFTCWKYQMKCIGYYCNLAKVCQPKAANRQSPYSATSCNARKSTAESNRRHQVIVGIGWRVYVMISALNCMRMQVMVQVMQAITKTAPLQ